MKSNHYISLINFKKLKRKKFFSLKEGDLVRVIYCNIDKGFLKLHSFSGICIKIANRDISSSFKIRALIDNCVVENIFKMYSPYLLDIDVLKKSKSVALKNSFHITLKKNKLS